MVIDVITYNGEKDLFDIRYNVLKDYVDEFIVVEFDKTFSGKDKPYYFEEIKGKYEKIRFCPMVEEDYEKYHEEACESPNTEYGRGAEHWIREFCQKESIKDCLTHLKDEDIVFIGDCDEVWSIDGIPAQMMYGDHNLGGVWKLQLKVYTYWLNNRSSEKFWGTIVGHYQDIKHEVLNHLRVNARKLDNYNGWHFTSMGGVDGVKKKLLDSYTKETYATDEVINNLEDSIVKQRDFLGRGFTYTVDESEWPQYLKDNKERYKHLCI